MDRNIAVNSQSVAEMLLEFKGAMSELDNLVNKLEGETNAVKQIWEGKASDSTLNEIKNFDRVFDNIKAQNQKYVSFINDVIEKYTDFDTTEKEYISESDRAFDTNYYGRRHPEYENK